MAGVIREYRMRITERGAETVDATTVAFTVEIDRLHEIPVVRSQQVFPLQGRTDASPFVVECIDIDGELTDEFSISGRWALIGRLVDLQYRAVDEDFTTTEDVWVSYGTGRVSQLDQLDGPGKYRVEVSDESWKAREGRIFEYADTTQIWPGGVVADWRGFNEAVKATGSLFDNFANVFFVKLLAVGFDGTAGTTEGQGARVTDAMLNWIRADLLPEEERTSVGDATITQGNFRHLRLNFGGSDYEILTFADPQDGPILQSIEEPEEVNSHFGSWAVRIWCWCYKGSSPEPPAAGDAYLYAPTAEPSEELPLHVGVAISGHDWGTSSGFIHVADMTRRYCELLGLAYDHDSFNELAADLSFPALSPRVTESPADPERWMQENIWGFCQVALLRTPDGKRKLVDLRPPRAIDEYLPVLEASNTRNMRWRLVGRDMVNSIRYKFLKLDRPGPTGARIPSPRDVIEGRTPFASVVPDTLDYFFVSEELTDPTDGDTLADSGRRLHTFDARAAARVHYNTESTFGGFASKLLVNLRMLASGAGSPIDPVVDYLTPATLNTYQDGLIRITGEVRGDVADALAEGDLIFVNLDSVAFPTPGFFGPALPGSVGQLNPGSGHGAPVAGPALGTLALNSDLTITVAVSSVPIGQTAVVEYAATTDGSEPPPSSSQLWLEAGTLTAAGNVTVPVQQRGTFVWIRVSGEIDDIRVSDFSTPEAVEVPDHPRFESAALILENDGQAIVTWQPSVLTLGVRVCWSIHEPGATVASECQDVEAASLHLQIPDVVPIGQTINVSLRAWSAWDSDTVAGTEGEIVPLSASRTGGMLLNDLLDVDVDSPADGESLIYDATTETWLPGSPSAGPHDLDSHTDVTITAPSDGQVLTYDSGTGQWVNEPGGASTTLDGLTDVDLDSLEDGDLLQYVETPGLWKNVKPDIYFGTDFPQATWANRLAFRTDRGILYHYDENLDKWLTDQRTLSITTAAAGATSATATFNALNPGWNRYDVLVETFQVAGFSTTTTAANYFTHQLIRRDGASTANVGSAISGQNDTQNAWVAHDQTINEIVTSAHEAFAVTSTETGTSSTFILASIIYREVG